MKNAYIFWHRAKFYFTCTKMIHITSSMFLISTQILHTRDRSKTSISFKSPSCSDLLTNIKVLRYHDVQNVNQIICLRQEKHIFMFPLFFLPLRHSDFEWQSVNIIICNAGSHTNKYFLFHSFPSYCSQYELH